MSGFLSGLLRAAVRGGRRAYEQSRREAEAAERRAYEQSQREAEAAGQQRFAAAKQKAQDLFARLNAGIETTEAAGVVSELDTLKQEFVALGGAAAAGILRELEALKQNIREMDGGGRRE